MKITVKATDFHLIALIAAIILGRKVQRPLRSLV